MALLSQVSTSYPRVLRDSFCPDTGDVFLLSTCPDTDSLCCQHPSYLFTDVDRCIMISVHLISTLTVIDMPFPDEAGHFQCQRIYFFQKWIFLLYMAGVFFNIFFVFSYSNLIIKHLIVQKTTTAKCFAKKYLSVLRSDRSGTICYVQYFFSWVSQADDHFYWSAYNGNFL